MRSPIILLALAACWGLVSVAWGQSAPATNEGSPLAPPGAAPPPPEEVNAFPFRPPPGWFIGGEAALLRTHASHLNPLLAFDAWQTEPVNELGLNVSPRGIVGYHFADGNALLASYRFLSASGDTTIPNPAHASFRYNTLDLDYQGRIHGPWLFFTAQWQTGLRLDSVEYNTDSIGPSLHGVWAQHFWGAGPHVGLNLAWYAGTTGLNLFARGDLGLLVGATRNSGSSQFIGPPNTIINFAPVDTSVHFSGPSFQTNELWNARAELGLGWVLPTRRWMRFEGGYLLDDFIWDSHIFTNFGPFLRFEMGF